MAAELPGTPDPRTHGSTTVSNGSRSRKFLNPTEADLAIRLVASFAALPEWQDRRITFGIIATYGRQVNTIRAAAERDAVLAGLIKAGRL